MHFKENWLSVKHSNHIWEQLHQSPDLHVVFSAKKICDLSRRHIYEVKGTFGHLWKCNNKALFYDDRKHSGSRRTFVANLQQQK